MKFKFLAVLALTGMVYAGCNSEKKGSTTDSAAVDSSTMDTTTADTSMKDTVMNKSTGKMDSTASGSGTGKGTNTPGTTNP